MLPSACAKSPQIPNATPKHGRCSSPPFISVHSLLLLACLPVTGAPFKRTSLHFKRRRLPLQFGRLPRTRTRTQLSAARALRIPWPPLPPLPELTPPQPRVVEIIIFYAFRGSPHTDTVYERRTKPTCLPTFVWARVCLSLSLSLSLRRCLLPICARKTKIHLNTYINATRQNALFRRVSQINMHYANAW